MLETLGYEVVRENSGIVTICWHIIIILLLQCTLIEEIKAWSDTLVVLDIQIVFVPVFTYSAHYP